MIRDFSLLANGIESLCDSCQHLKAGVCIPMKYIRPLERPGPKKSVFVNIIPRDSAARDQRNSHPLLHRNKRRSHKKSSSEDRTV